MSDHPDYPAVPLNLIDDLPQSKASELEAENTCLRSQLDALEAHLESRWRTEDRAARAGGPLAWQAKPRAAAFEEALAALRSGRDAQ